MSGRSFPVDGGLLGEVVPDPPPATALEALIAAGWEEPVESTEERLERAAASPLRAVIAEVMAEVLTDDERYAIETTVMGQLTARQAAGLHDAPHRKTHINDLRNRALKKLRTALGEHPTIREYLKLGED